MIDEKKLRECLYKKKGECVGKMSNFSEASVHWECWNNRLISIDELLKKLDAGDFDEKV